jgi:hypothetical protein
MLVFYVETRPFGDQAVAIAPAPERTCTAGGARPLTSIEIHETETGLLVTAMRFSHRLTNVLVMRPLTLIGGSGVICSTPMYTY